MQNAELGVRDKGKEAANSYFKHIEAPLSSDHCPLSTEKDISRAADDRPYGFTINFISNKAVYLRLIFIGMSGTSSPTKVAEKFYSNLRCLTAGALSLHR